MSALITDAALAEEFGLDLDRFHRIRRDKKWPCVKLDRTTILFTPEQREQIIAMQTVGSPASRALSTGQTARSAARRRSA